MEIINNNYCYLLLLSADLHIGTYAAQPGYQPVPTQQFSQPPAQQFNQPPTQQFNQPPTQQFNQPPAYTPGGSGYAPVTNQQTYPPQQVCT